MKRKKLFLSVIGIVALVAIIALLIFINQKPTHKTGDTSYYGNGVSIETNHIFQRNGIHIFLPPNSALLPNNLSSHGCRIEIKYPVVSFYNKKAEALINEQIKEYVGIGRNDLRIPHDGGCYISTDFDCEVLEDTLVITITESSYICGATHGSLRQKTYYFDLDTGGIINVTDIFHPEIDYEHDLGVIILKHLKNYNTYYEYDNYYDDESDLVNWIGDWKIRKDGVQIYYMPYMGPAPGGNIESVFIPYKEIEPLINRESPLWQMLGNEY